MAPPVTYALLHGGGSEAWDWHLVVPELEARGHRVVAIDLPADDPAAGLDDLAGAVVDAIGDAERVVVVAHSWGGFVAPLVATRVPTELLVLVAGMIPKPGEPFSAYWAATEYDSPHDVSDPATFFHDVAPAIAGEASAHEREFAETSLTEPWPLPAWPDVPTRFLLCRDDRLFPAEWMRGVVRDRLGIEPDEIDGGHMVALARPAELAEKLEELRESPPVSRERPFRAAHVDDLERIDMDGMLYRPVRRPLGVTAFGANAYTGAAPGDEVIEAHDETTAGSAGHEELYVVVGGRATFEVGGETLDAPVGTLVLVPVGVQRHAVAAEPDTTVLVIGGPEGAAGPVSAFESWYAAWPAYAAGDFERAYAIAAEGLDDHPEHPSLHYYLACFGARAGDREAAVGHLRVAFDGNPQSRARAADDPDLEGVRDDPRLQQP